MGMRLRKKFMFDREKNRPFECGFTPKFNSRLPFSIRFFLISLIFLVFDVELVLIFPFILRLKLYRIFYIIFLLTVFLLILSIGLAHEWNQGRLDWAN